MNDLCGVWPHWRTIVIMYEICMECETLPQITMATIPTAVSTDDPTIITFYNVWEMMQQHQ